MGLVTTEQTTDTLYLRGIEEVCHHSFVLRRAQGPGVCEQIGCRTATEDDLDRAEAFFRRQGAAPEWVEVPGQGRTLRVRDGVGVPLEFCAQMTRLPSRAYDYNDHRGGTALRTDHVQLHMADVGRAWDVYAALGFRASEYQRAQDGRIKGVWLHRKDSSWDFVLLENRGPRLHHIGFICPSLQNLFDACDMAGRLGYGRIAERGPGTHLGGHGRFVYFRDPDGHRVELVLPPPHHRMDLESEVAEEIGQAPLPDWCLPPQESWWNDATEFAGLPPIAPQTDPGYLTLETYLDGRRQASRQQPSAPPLAPSLDRIDQ